ncbi:hypothetical protein AtNW77_Chr2g0250271 [Arabidopsis thaliana]
MVTATLPVCQQLMSLSDSLANVESPEKNGGVILVMHLLNILNDTFDSIRSSTEPSSIILCLIPRGLICATDG